MRTGTALGLVALLGIGVATCSAFPHFSRGAYKAKIVDISIKKNKYIRK